MPESLAGRFPVQRGEGGDVVDGPGGELRQDVVEVFTQIDLEAFAGLHDGEDGRDFGTGFLTADVQPVFATEREGTHGILAEILIDLEATILEVNLQARPLVKGVLAGFCEFARWQSMQSNLGDLRLEFFKDYNASLLTHRQTLLRAGSGRASFPFHGIELAHE